LIINELPSFITKFFLAVCSGFFKSFKDRFAKIPLQFPEALFVIHIGKSLKL